MPNWHQVLEEINAEFKRKNSGAFDTVRRKYLKDLAGYTGRNVIAYYSGWLQKPQVNSSITDEDKNGFMLCIHGMERTKGLDLVLHTPGGGLAPTESLINYLDKMFHGDVRAIIPQIAMSAGTILACSCKSIVMGRQSNLGPIDPQINGLPAFGTKKEFEKAYKEIIEDQRAASVWRPVLSQLYPSFLQSCDYAIGWTRKTVRESLLRNMLSGRERNDARRIAGRIIRGLSDLQKNKGHDKHFHHDECIAMGLNVEMMEKDDRLQDAILTVHHCFMHTLANTAAYKIIENDAGQAFMKLQPQQAMPTVSIDLGRPPG